jgi:hypothetical protein
MAYVTTEERVDRLEALFGQFMTEIAMLNKRADERNKAAEERMARFEAEMRQSKRELDTKWGNLANKLGTIIEDILAPNVRRLADDHFELGPLIDFMIRRSRRHPSQPQLMAEFDVLAIAADAVILGEAKSSPSADAVDAFRHKVAGFFDFFPEYRGRRLIGIFGSWSIPEDLVNRLTGCGIYALQIRSETMDLANAAALESR